MPDDTSPRKVAENGLSSSLLRTVTQIFVNLMHSQRQKAQHILLQHSFFLFVCLTRSMVLVIFVVELFNADLISHT